MLHGTMNPTPEACKIFYPGRQGLAYDVSLACGSIIPPFTTEFDPVTGISITPFDMGGVSPFGLVVSVSILVVENDSSYKGFSLHEPASATAVVDAESGTI